MPAVCCCWRRSASCRRASRWCSGMMKRRNAPRSQRNKPMQYRKNCAIVRLAWIWAASCVTPGTGRPGPLVGTAAIGDWHADRPGVARLIKPEDLPKPGATPSAASVSHKVRRPASVLPQVPAGFNIELFADGLSGPRQMRVAPNGDIFIAETRAGRIRGLQGTDGSPKPSTNQIYAGGLHEPFGIAFFPSGDNPQWVYVANTGSVVRFPYKL